MIGVFEGAIPRLDKVLQIMAAAEPTVEPQGRHESAYLMVRTKTYRDDMRAEITQRQAMLVFDRAFRKKSSIPQEQFVADLEASLKLFETARQQAQIATTDFAEIIDHPAHLETLYNLNVGTLMSFDPAVDVKNCELPCRQAVCGQCAI